MDSSGGLSWSGRPPLQLGGTMADLDASANKGTTSDSLKILSAALAATLALWREWRYALAAYCRLLLLVFA
jgi:hypothetical protein